MSQHHDSRRRFGAVSPRRLDRLLRHSATLRGDPVLEVPGDVIDCADYTAHRSAHRFAAGAWTCDTCRPEGDPRC